MGHVLYIYIISVINFRVPELTYDTVYYCPDTASLKMKIDM